MGRVVGLEEIGEPAGTEVHGEHFGAQKGVVSENGK